MAGNWSGLAPAVDAHLAQWHKAQRGMPLIHQAQVALDKDANMATNDGLVRAISALLHNGWTNRWIVFASSYGIPDEDGVAMATSGVREGQTIVGREQFTANEAAISQGCHLAMREHKMLGQAITHYVSAEVLDEIDEAAELAEMEPIFVTDLMTPNGFAVFERPIIFPDLDPQSGRPHPSVKVSVRAIGWTYEPEIFSNVMDDFGPGLSIFLYTTGDDYATTYLGSLTDAGLPLPYEAEDVEAEGLLQMECIPWRFGVGWGARDEVAYRPGTVPHPVAMQRRWFLAFMRLMWQEIIVRRTEHHSRAETRRWERFRKPILDYTVLRLRREVDPLYNTPGGGVSLDHRIRVRGHWRRQHYPSLGDARNNDGTMNPLSHRLVWIEPHWRGPEDAPLGPLHSATSVVR